MFRRKWPKPYLSCNWNVSCDVPAAYLGLLFAHQMCCGPYHELRPNRRHAWHGMHDPNHEHSSRKQSPCPPQVIRMQALISLLPIYFLPCRGHSAWGLIHATHAASFLLATYSCTLQPALQMTRLNSAPSQHATCCLVSVAWAACSVSTWCFIRLTQTTCGD